MVEQAPAAVVVIESPSESAWVIEDAVVVLGGHLGCAATWRDPSLPRAYHFALHLSGSARVSMR